MSLEHLFDVLRPLIPLPLFRALQSPYHFLLSYLGALRYHFPSRALTVIAVTGTKGKTSTTELINAILEEAGEKTALANTIRFKVGSDSKRNLFKMTMPGRFFQQRFLAEARGAGCRYAIMEMSSEGARQHRHRFIDLDALVVTNLAHEHIESHGSFEAYRSAKLSIAHQLSVSNKKRKLLLVNADDENLMPFRSIEDVETLLYTLQKVTPYRGDEAGSAFTYSSATIVSKLPGVFSIYNMLAAATLGSELGISLGIVKRALERTVLIPGRAERIEEGQRFPVIVDYAHTPESLEALYKAFDDCRRICVLGNTGGGRDRSKRPKMGSIADQYCDAIILTNEDPYDENPRAILADMEGGIKKHKPEIILDRREAIGRSLRLANELTRGSHQNRVAVLVTGKGTDPYLMETGGKKTPWSDAAVTRHELRKLLHPAPSPNKAV